MLINYIEGDLFAALPKQDKTSFICHVANDLGVMGSGFVVPLAKKYPEAKFCYEKWHKNEYVPRDIYNTGTFGLGEVGFVRTTDPNVVVANMVAQRGVGGIRPLRYNALSECLEKVADYLMEFQVENFEIVAPLFGAGLAGGNWDFIKLLIQDSWIDRGIPVSIYYMLDKLPPGFTPPK